jgi:hypothetical protein
MRWLETLRRWFKKTPARTPWIALAPHGFSVLDVPTPLFEVAWADVREIVAYKEDLFSYDEICLGFRTDAAANYWRLTEEFSNYKILLLELERRFPDIRTDWFHEVAYPEFATNWTTLWGEPFCS